MTIYEQVIEDVAALIVLCLRVIIVILVARAMGVSI